MWLVCQTPHLISSVRFGVLQAFDLVVHAGLAFRLKSLPTLDEIVRDGVRQMLAAALQAEVAAHVEAHVGD